MTTSEATSLEGSKTKLRNPVRGMSIATLVSRAMGFLKNIVLASTLGTAVVADTYNVANQLPNMVFTVVAGGVLGSVFVPQLVKARSQGQEAWSAYARKLISSIAWTTGYLGLVLALCSPWIIEALQPSNWTESDLRLSVFFAYICLPQIFFYSVYATLGQVLNSCGRFASMSWAPAVNNVIVICVALTLFHLGGVDPKQSESVSAETAALLGLGTTAGVLLQCAVLLPALRGTGIGFGHKSSRKSQISLAPALKLAKWTGLQLVVTQAIFLVSMRLTAEAGGELSQHTTIASGFSAYNYAYLLVLLPHAVVAAPVATTLLPKLSADAHAGEYANFSHRLARAIGALQCTIFPIMLFMIVGLPSVAPLFFAYGNTNTQDAWYIGLIGSAFSVGLWSMSRRSLLLYACYAVEDTRVPLMGVMIGGAANVALAVVSLALLEPWWKLIGITLAFALGNVFTNAFVSYSLRKRLLLNAKAKGLFSWKMLLPLVAGLVAAQSMMLLMSGNWFFVPPSDMQSTLQSFAPVVSCGVGGLVTFVLAEKFGASILSAFRTRI